MAHGGRGLVAVFWGSFASVGKFFILAGGAGRWVIVPWGLDTFLIFPNILGFLVLGRSAAHEAIPLYIICHIPRIYHFCK